MSPLVAIYLFIEKPKPKGPEKRDHFLAYLPPEDKEENLTKMIWFKDEIQRISTKLVRADDSPGLLVTFWMGLRSACLTSFR